jgi:hypothetical protein
MSILSPDRLRCALYLVGLSCNLACYSGGAGTEAGIGSSTGEASTAPTVPTAGVSGDGPTTTTSTSTSTQTTSTSTSGDEPSTSSSGAETTTGGLSGCGDGILDATEECDDGAAGNDDTRFCKEDCTLNVCGDGKLFVDWELCDQGVGNSDAYGSLCGPDCTPGARCGDKKLQPEFETCDLGPNNGGEKGDEQGILCDTSCRAQQLRGFVTTSAFTGNLGGLFNADLKCRDAAAAAGLAEPERFHALLSTGNVHAKERFKDVAAALPYVLVTGKKFADSFTALIEAGPLGEGIAATETGAALYKTYVVTNTDPGGISHSPSEHCEGWTSDKAAFEARVGVNAVPLNAPDWEDWKNKQAWLGATIFDCDKTFFHLYCLEI